MGQLHQKWHHFLCFLIFIVIIFSCTNVHAKETWKLYIFYSEKKAQLACDAVRASLPASKYNGHSCRTKYDNPPTGVSENDVYYVWEDNSLGGSLHHDFMVLNPCPDGFTIEADGHCESPSPSTDTWKIYLFYSDELAKAACDQVSASVPEEKLLGYDCRVKYDNPPIGKSENDVYYIYEGNSSGGKLHHDFLVITENVDPCPVGRQLGQNGFCEDIPTCKCNENFLNGECVAMEPATTWDQTNDLFYEYPDNNHEDAPRCEPKKTDEVDGVVNSCSSAGNGTSTTNPIDCATGQKKYTEVDYQGFGLDALTYTRRYETTVEADSLTFDTTAAMVSTGQGWQSETPRLVTKTFADGAKAVYFKLGSRIARIFFYPAGSDTYQTNGNMTGITLTEENGKQVVTLSTGQRYSFNSAGQVASYQPKMSNDDERYTYTWDGELLIKKENRFGRYLSFRYDDQNRLTQLTDQDGVSVYYQYDDAGNLAKVIYPDGTPDDLTDNPFKQYQFENTAFPNNVTGIVDQDGTQLATIAYNADGKATLSELNNSAERTEVNYPEDGKAIVKFFRDVESDAYRQETYSYAKFRGRYQLTAKAITKCDNCELTTETWDYNDAELLERHTDPAGVITEWAYDSKARKIKTIVAKGTDQEQTTTYTWNETHNAIETITTATDVTTYTFDERGNRIATVVTPLQSE